MTMLFSALRSWRRPAGVGGTIAAALLIAGCAASPTANYYTLVPAAQPRSAPAGGAPGYLIEVLPVSVPSQVDQPQIMLRDAAGSITPRSSERWTAPWSDELQDALADGLTRSRGVLDVDSVKPGREDPVWRVQTSINRFDSVLGDAAIVDATWRLRPINISGPVLLCRTQVRVAADGPGIDGLVRAHQAAVQDLALTIAGAIRNGARSAPAGVGSAKVSGCHSSVS